MNGSGSTRRTTAASRCGAEASAQDRRPGFPNRSSSYRAGTGPTALPGTTWYRATHTFSTRPTWLSAWDSSGPRPHTGWPQERKKGKGWRQGRNSFFRSKGQKPEGAKASKRNGDRGVHVGHGDAWSRPPRSPTRMRGAPAHPQELGHRPGRQTTWEQCGSPSRART